MFGCCQHRLHLTLNRFLATKTELRDTYLLQKCRRRCCWLMKNIILHTSVYLSVKMKLLHLCPSASPPLAMPKAWQHIHLACQPLRTFKHTHIVCSNILHLSFGFLLHFTSCSIRKVSKDFRDQLLTG